VHAAHLLMISEFLTENTKGSSEYWKFSSDRVILLSTINATFPVPGLPLGPAIHWKYVLFSELHNIIRMYNILCKP